MSPPEKLPTAPRKRPMVAITLSKGVLALVDKRAKEAKISRSRVIESAILATWGEDFAPEGSKGGFVVCDCGAGAFIDGGPDLDLAAAWECKRCRDNRLGLRVPTFDEAAPLLKIPEVAEVRGWSNEGDRRFLTVTPSGEKRDLIRALLKIEWEEAGYCAPRVGPRPGVVELVWA